MRKGLSQEGLKLIACITMLIDHIGYEVVYALYGYATTRAMADSLRLVYCGCRVIGRLALPIYAFLIVEGFYHTRDQKKYALRLTAGALLSEIPFDLMVSGSIGGPQQSVMATLLLGYLALLCMNKCRNLVWKPVAAIPFALLAEVLRADYGWYGVALVVLFALSRYMPQKNLIRFCAMIVLAHYKTGMVLSLGSIDIPMQALAALSVLFLEVYDGRKLTQSKTVQWTFYFFYPVHMLILWLISTMLKMGILL